MNTFAILFLIALSQVFAQMSENFIHHPRNLGIINGKEAVPHSFPYQVAIYITNSKGQDFCGGSLISALYVLTAAHCLHGATSLRVIFGAHYINNNDEEGRVVQIVNLSNFIFHPEWTWETIRNDIALVKLVAPISQTNQIQWIQLASGTDTYTGRQATVAGWGKTNNEQTHTSDVLYYIKNLIMSNEECKVDDAYKEVIKPTNVCLLGKYHNINVSTCGGDSGGPLVVDRVQVGISSFGIVDCMAGYPSVFTRVSEYADWIRNIIGV